MRRGITWMSRRRIASVSSELYFDGASGVSVMYLYGCMGQWGMANRTAPALVLREGDRGELERLTRAATVMASTAQRARIVLLAADGVGNQVIADTVGVSRPTVNLWRDRYVERGVRGLADEPRPGRPRQVDRVAILAATLDPPPASLGVTHWSSRLLAPRLGVDHATVAAVWKEFGVRPWKAETFKFSTDPELVASIEVALEAGRRYPLRITLEDDYQHAYIHFFWSRDGAPKEIVPPEALYPVMSEGGEGSGEIVEIRDPNGERFHGEIFGAPSGTSLSRRRRTASSSVARSASR